MTNFDIKQASQNVILNPKSKVVHESENQNGAFTTIATPDGLRSVMFIDRDFDSATDSMRFEAFDEEGRLARIFDDDDLDGEVDSFAIYKYSQQDSCVGFWDFDNDGKFDEYEMPDCDEENDNGRFTTLFAKDGLSSELYVDRDFDGIADDKRTTYYNENGARTRVIDDFDLDGKPDRIGYFKINEEGEEVFSAWDNGADGKIDFYNQY